MAIYSIKRHYRIDHKSIDIDINRDAKKYAEALAYVDAYEYTESKTRIEKVHVPIGEIDIHSAINLRKELKFRLDRYLEFTHDPNLGRLKIHFQRFTRSLFGHAKWQLTDKYIEMILKNIENGKLTLKRIPDQKDNRQPTQ